MHLSSPQLSPAGLLLEEDASFVRKGRGAYDCPVQQREAGAAGAAPAAGAQPPPSAAAPEVSGARRSLAPRPLPGVSSRRGVG